MYRRTASPDLILHVPSGSYIPTVRGVAAYEAYLEWRDETDPPREPDAYVPPAAPVPNVVSPFQAKAALLAAGLLDDVEAAIVQAPDLVRLAWSEAVEFRRGSPSVVAMAQGLGWTEQQLDALFVAAAEIEA